MLALTLATQLVDLPTEAEVALSYRVSDLSTLSSRESGFSESFSLPLTNRNLRVFELAHSLDSTTTVPYRRLPFELTQNDVLVLEGQAILDRSATGYDITLVSTAGALFAAVGERGLRDIDLSAYDHLLTDAAVRAAQTVNKDTVYTYPLINDGRLSERGLLPNLATIHYTELAPAIFTRGLLKQMVADALPGYTLTGTLLEEDIFQRHQLLGGDAGPRRRQTYLDQHSVVARTSQVTEVVSTTTEIEGKVLSFDQILSDPGGHMVLSGDNAITYKLLPEVSDYRVQLEGTFRYDQANIFTAAAFLILAENRMAVKDSNKILYTGAGQVQPTTSRFKLDLTVNRASLNDFISASLLVGGRLRLRIDAGAKLTVTPLARAYDNSPVHLDACLPDWKQSELLLLIANQFGVIFQTDPVTRTVRADLLDDVQQNRTSAKVVDWTKKIDFSERPRIRYRLDGLAQRNIFRYSDAPSGYASLNESEYTAAGELLCPTDTTLDAENEAYVSPTPALREDGALGRRAVLAYVPRFTLKENTAFRLYRLGQDYEKDEFVLHAGRYWKASRDSASTPTVPDEDWQPVAEDEVYTGGEADYYCGLYTPLTTAPEARVGESGNVPGWLPSADLTFVGLDFGADLLPRYYPVLENAFKRVLLLEVNVRLNAVDMATLDFTVPVLLDIEHWPGYGPLQGIFFLHLVDQYQPGYTGPVVCELLALGGPFVSQAFLPEKKKVFDYTFSKEFN